MKWYIKNSHGYYWMGPVRGWGTTKPEKYDSPNEAMADLLSMRAKDTGKPIIFSCGIEILQDTN